MAGRTQDEAVADQVVDLWNARTAKGMPFLASQEDVEPMRQILEGRGGSDELYVKLDALHEALEQEIEDMNTVASGGQYQIGRVDGLKEWAAKIEKIL